MNIFVSRPNEIGQVFEKAYAGFDEYLKRFGLSPCRLGANKYTINAPLIGVMNLMEKCHGVITLGYPKYEFSTTVLKGDKLQHQILKLIPTAWNHIEATLGFSRKLPVLIVAHEGISEGVFDPKVTGKYVFSARLDQVGWFRQKSFKGVFYEWKNQLPVVK